MAACKDPELEEFRGAIGRGPLPLLPAAELFRLFSLGVPIMLLKILWLTRSTAPPELCCDLQILEIFAGKATVVNAGRVFGYSSTSYDLLEDKDLL